VDKPIQANELTIEEKIGQLFFIGISGPSFDTATEALMSEIHPGGVCFFSRNIKDPNQTRDLLHHLSQSQHIPLFLSIDQEGGLVDRLRRVMTPAPAAAKFRNVPDIKEFAAITAESMRILGFNMDFAPVVDVITEQREDAGNGMYSRGFGRDRDDVVELAGAFLTSLQHNGVIGCLKHFPGLGSARVDSHEELPLIDICEEELRSTDLYPYASLLGANVQMVMIAHAAYPNSNLQQEDQNGRLLPSSLSFNFVSRLLRDEMGFSGIAITDDLEMGAIVRNYGIGEACKMAFEAGNDMLAICAGREHIEEGRNAITKAVESGDIDIERIDRSVGRILELKRNLKSPLAFDLARLRELTQKLANLNSRLN
jgi:beta-N-acetylhexosaminidase